MCQIIICDGDEAERNHLMELIHLCYQEIKQEATVTGCANWQELECMAKRELPSVTIVAQNGVDGLNTVTSARFLSRRMIWFSDLDFGAQAYRLCILYFSQKPITLQKMKQALSRVTE